MDHAEKTMLLVPISEMVDRMQPVGSRVTCNPAPTDTDEDYLLYLGHEYGTVDGVPMMVVKDADIRLMEVELYLKGSGWEMGGSIPNEVRYDVNPSEKFCSWTLEELNLIITTSDEFFRRFLAATAVAKEFNLMEKADRIKLFQAVLYGKHPEVC